MQVVDIAYLGVTGVVAELAGRVGEGSHYPPGGLLGRGCELDMVIEALAHLLFPIQTEHHREVGELGLGLGEGLAEDVVEAAHDLTRYLQVGQLVFAHGHSVRFVEHDVSGHQHGIAHKTIVNVVRLHLDLFLEGGDAKQPAQRRHHAEQGEKLGYLGHMGLDKEDAFVGIEPRRQPVEYHIAGIRFEHVGILQGGQGMDIHYAVDALVVLLKFDVVLDSPQIVTDVLLACRPGTGENAALFQKKPPENVPLSVTQNESGGKVKKSKEG